MAMISFIIYTIAIFATGFFLDRLVRKVNGE